MIRLGRPRLSPRTTVRRTRATWQRPMNQPIRSTAIVSDGPSRGKRWLLATCTGLLIGVPVSGLLSLAGLLPMYLGPFFFLLFGLAVGAGIFRVAKPLRPVSVVAIACSAAVVITATFVGALSLECAQLGPHAARMVAKKTRQLPPGVTSAEFRASVSRRTRQHLAEDFPPGGLIGYVRWAATDGRFEFESPRARPQKVPYVFTQSNIGWTLRVVASFLLLVGGVLSQVLPLRRSDAVPEEAPASPPAEPTCQPASAVAAAPEPQNGSQSALAR